MSTITSSEVTIKFQTSSGYESTEVFGPKDNAYALARAFSELACILLIDGIPRSELVEFVEDEVNSLK